MERHSIREKEMDLEKKKRMKKSTPNKGLLIPWLLRALDGEWYKGLRWCDRYRKIFYVNWTHKSAEQWSESEIEVCEGWATHKGKKAGKNVKQMKATFRCALNSKKELKEVERTKRQRFWQFIDPSECEATKSSKKGPKKDALVFKNIDSPGTSTDDNTCDHSIVKRSTSVTTVFKTEAEIENVRLPSFEAFRNFFPLTPPHQCDDIFFFDTDFSESCSAPSEDSRLTPPADIPVMSHQHPTVPSRVHHLSTDVWQPNFMSIPQGLQDFTSFTQFSNSLDNLIRPLCQDSSTTENIPSTVPEMDQYVPVIDSVRNYSVSLTQYSCAEKSESCNIMCDSTNLEDDYLLNFVDYADPVACEKLIKELNRLSPT